MSLRSEFLREWRIWYSMTYKAKRDDVPMKTDWLDFELWLEEVGPRPKGNYQFCRDDSPFDPNTPWNEETAGWRKMPCGRQAHKYRNYYTTSKATLEKIRRGY